MIIADFLIYACSAAVIGVLIGLSGVGGGSLMTPWLIFVLKVNPITAVATDLVFVTLAKFFGAWRYSSKKMVNWFIVRWMAVGSVSSCILTLLLFGNQIKNHAEQIIMPILGSALFITGVLLLLRPYRKKFAHKRIKNQKIIRVILVATGVLIGALVTITSVGAGAIGLAMLVAVYPQAHIARLVGTDIAHSVILAGVAGSTYWLHMDAVDFNLLGALLVGGIPGVYIGSMLTPSLPEKIITPILAILLVGIGIKFLL